MPKTSSEDHPRVLVTGATTPGTAGPTLARRLERAGVRADFEPDPDQVGVERMAASGAAAVVFVLGEDSGGEAGGGAALEALGRVRARLPSVPVLATYPGDAPPGGGDERDPLRAGADLVLPRREIERAPLAVLMRAALRCRELALEAQRLGETAGSGSDAEARATAERKERDLMREQAGRREAEATAELNEFLAEAGRRLASSLDPGQIVETLAEGVLQRMGDVCLVEILQPAARLPDRSVVMGRPDVPRPRTVERLREYAGDRLLPGVVEQLRGRPPAPIVVEEVTREWLAQSAGDRAGADLVADLRPRSMIAVPLQTADVLVGTLVVMHVDGGRPFEEASPVLASELGRRAALALENARLFRMAEQANRSKTDFLNIISHELRTPLTGIMGYVGLLEEEIAGPVTDGQRSYLEGIERNSNELLHIIDQILVFADTEAEREEVRFAEEPLQALLDDVAALARPMAERDGLEFRYERPAEEATIQTDPAKIRQILVHLLANAVKFTREGWVRLAGRLEDGTLVLEVEDTGIGIPEEKYDQIFEAFTQVEASATRVAGGTGIGLNVVRNLVELLDGKVEVRSVPGEGSTFTVRVPLTGGPSRRRGTARGAREAGPERAGGRRAPRR